MPSLGASFGRGAATTAQWDIANANAVIIMGSNMAEAHPIAFRFVMQAKEKGATVIHVEGDPRSPINQGTLCPKGAATMGWIASPERLTHVKYRAPYSDHWEDKPLDWAMEQIAQRVKQTRDETFVHSLPDGTVVNHTLGLAELGGATLDNEENYVIKKLFGGGLGVVAIENQARV